MWFRQTHRLVSRPAVLGASSCLETSREVAVGGIISGRYVDSRNDTRRWVAGLDLKPLLCTYVLYLSRSKQDNGLD